MRSLFLCFALRFVCVFFLRARACVWLLCNGNSTIVGCVSHDPYWRNVRAHSALISSVRLCYRARSCSNLRNCTHLLAILCMQACMRRRVLLWCAFRKTHVSAHTFTFLGGSHCAVKFHKWTQLHIMALRTLWHAAGNGRGGFRHVVMRQKQKSITFGKLHAFASNVKVRIERARIVMWRGGAIVEAGLFYVDLKKEGNNINIFIQNRVPEKEGLTVYDIVKTIV